jgi:non-ribosomal peptide synthase protein (TIGR01720 family)
VYWSGQPWQKAARLPVNGVRSANTAGSTARLVSSLTIEETNVLVQEAPDRLGARVHEIILAALYVAVRDWSGHESVLVDVEGHGREDIVAGADLSRTVGWFTTLFPVLLEAPAAADGHAVLDAIKTRVRAVPHGGIGYGVLRYLAPDPAVRARLASCPRPELSFLYLGRGDRAAERGWMRPSADPVRATRSLRGQRYHALEVGALVSGGRLQVGWQYSEALHTAATIAGLGESLLGALRQLISQAPAHAAPAFTPEDFPAARVGQDDLDRLLSAIRGGGPSLT